MERIILRPVRRVLRARNIEVDHHRLLPAADDHRFPGLIFVRVQLLMRHVRGHVDEIAWSSLIYKLQPISPSKTRSAADDVNHRLDFAVMMRTSLGVRL